MKRYKINDVEMPPATKMEPESNNLYGENTGRDETGFNHLDLIRSDVKKWNAVHEMITDAELSLIKNALNPSGFIVEAEYFGEIVKASCYGKISGIKLRGNPNGKNYWDCNVAIIEN